MSALTWGAKPPVADMGLDRGVLYFSDAVEVWNGLVDVATDEPAETSATYFDGVKFANTVSDGDISATVTAYTYPSRLLNGPVAGMCFRSSRGDNPELHILYNIVVIPDTAMFQTVSSNVSPSLFKFRLGTSPSSVWGARPSAHVTLKATWTEAPLNTLETILYGSPGVEPRLPSINEIVDIYEDATQLRITYLGDGLYQADGPDELLQVNADGSFVITSPGVLQNTPFSYFVSSH